MTSADRYSLVLKKGKGSKSGGTMEGEVNKKNFRQKKKSPQRKGISFYTMNVASPVDGPGEGKSAIPQYGPGM